MNKDWEGYKLVLEFFEGNEDKATKWFDVPNPLLGLLKPIHMIKLGKEDKLLRFIKIRLDENKRD